MRYPEIVYAYVFVIIGEVTLNHNRIETRDAAKVEDENSFW